MGFQRSATSDYEIEFRLWDWILQKYDNLQIIFCIQIIQQRLKQNEEERLNIEQIKEEGLNIEQNEEERLLNKLKRKD